MKTTAETFRRMQATLHHLAVFPHANRAKICERDGLTLADVEGTLVDLGARISADGRLWSWDEDTLNEAAKAFGVTLGEFQAPVRATTGKAYGAAQSKRPASQTATLPEGAGKVALLRSDKEADALAALVALKFSPRDARARVAAAAQALPATSTVEQLTKYAIKHPATPGGIPSIEPTPAPRHRTKLTHDRIAQICRFLIEDPTRRESEACRSAGVAQGSWSFFKKRTFGPGPADRTKLEAYLAGKPIPTRQTAKRRRLEETAQAPAASVALRPVRAELTPAPVDLLGDLLRGHLTRGGRCTHVVGQFRLEVDLRLVPVP